MSYAVHPRSSYGGNPQGAIYETGEPDRDCHHPKFPHDWPRTLGLQIPSDLDWMAQGKCVHSDLPFSDVRRGERRLRDMRAICDSCPVQYACLEYGLEQADEFRGRPSEIPGIWGGLTGPEVAQLWRETRRRHEHVLRAD